MEKFIVYLVNEDESKSPIMEADTLEEAMEYCSYLDGITSIEKITPFGAVVIS